MNNAASLSIFSDLQFLRTVGMCNQLPSSGKGRGNTCENQKETEAATNSDATPEKTSNTSYMGGRRNDLKDRSFLSEMSFSITKTLEDMFESHGRLVATYPLTTVGICFVITSICSLGSVNFVTELRPFRLWIPQHSEFIKVLNWQAENFPSSYRQQMAIWEADNVLTANVMQQMLRLHKKIKQIRVGPNDTSWEDVCVRVPSLPMNSHTKPEEEHEDVDYDRFDYGTLSRKRRSNTEDDRNSDLSLVLPRDQYCQILESLPRLCLETSLLEIWGLDENVIMSLTDEQVIKDVNDAKLSRVFGFKSDFTKYLGSVVYDEQGRIVSAKAATHMWITLVNDQSIRDGDFVIDKGSGEAVDTAGMAWEHSWMHAVLEASAELGNITVYAQAASSFGDISEKNIWGDVKWLMLGICVMISFVNITLGRRNLVEQRPLLAFMGLVSVAQGVAIAYGVCSMLKIPYNPVNSILPILLIGLGVDDMFVIMAAWESVGHHKGASVDLVERAGKTMRHAGVAITVTSLTDVTAFAVGASTDLPALRSFCIYASLGIFAVYVLQSTFFVVWLVADQKRMEGNRNGFFWCIVHHDWKPYACSQRDLMSEAFKSLASCLLSTRARIFILVSTGALMAVSVLTTLNLHQEFNPMWFIPQDSYLYKSFEAAKLHFPENGEKGYIYFANVTLPEDLVHLNKLVDDLISSGVVTEVNAWFTALDNYLSHAPDHGTTAMDYSLLQDKLLIFLQSSSGASYQNDFSFDGQLECLSPAPPVRAFRISIMHKPAPTPKEQSEALRAIKTLVSGVPIHGYRAAWAQAYSIWETNEVVGTELWRNIFLAGAVVGVVTLVLLASLLASVLVLVCVGFTVIGVSGTMWLWGLTIDTVSCIALVLAIGLSVDYAAHIAHAFLSVRGTDDKKERARVALQGAGSAVLQGGVSTLLAFVLLAWSSSHVFVTFFKIFTAASILGLYYGLVFLPVVLSFIGPSAYSDTTAVASDSTNVNRVGNNNVSQESKEFTKLEYSSGIV
ncbi:patched domain-containing protein 3-like [Palaemon carinicauda]|uniref:patched domain-containing protein 3-like n=1 Tax=Palaemon carinicauda TaxID=392227 RepID=UPI0035B5B871